MHRINKVIAVATLSAVASLSTPSALAGVLISNKASVAVGDNNKTVANTSLGTGGIAMGDHATILISLVQMLGYILGS